MYSQMINTGQKNKMSLRVSELESLTQKVNVRMAQAVFRPSCFGCVFLTTQPYADGDLQCLSGGNRTRRRFDVNFLIVDGF